MTDSQIYPKQTLFNGSLVMVISNTTTPEIATASKSITDGNITRITIATASRNIATISPTTNLDRTTTTIKTDFDTTEGTKVVVTSIGDNNPLTEKINP